MRALRAHSVAPDSRQPSVLLNKFIRGKLLKSKIAKLKQGESERQRGAEPTQANTSLLAI